MKLNISTTSSTVVDLLPDRVEDKDDDSTGNQSTPIEIFVILCLTLNLLLICTTVWILVCMIAYGRKTRKLTFRPDRINVDGGHLYIACVVAVACCLPRLIISQVLFHVDAIPGAASGCEIIMDVGVVAFYIALWLVYFFLWLRHRAVYSHPTVKGLMCRYSNIISWILLIGLSLISLGVLCGFTIPETYSLGPNGCFVLEHSKVQDEYGSWARNANYAMAGFLILAQTSFLTLLIYPMIATKRIRRSQSPPSTLSSRRTVDRLDNITTTIYRSVIGATVTICSDLIVAVLVSVAIPKYIPRSITFTIYDVNLLINIFCIMATFGNNRVIMLVFCHRVRSLETTRNTNRANETHTIGTMSEEIV